MPAQEAEKWESGFVSNGYLDGGIKFSSPFLGIGINASYTKTDAETTEGKMVHSSCLFNNPRVIVELDSSYLEPSKQFIDDIDSVLRYLPTKAKLEEVLATYGHMYPRRITLGGHLFYSEEHVCTGSVEENQKRKDIEASFKIALFLQPTVHASASRETKHKQESSKQSSSITFQAVGGDTLRCRNPLVWLETVADPTLRRVIKQDDYKPVLTLLGKSQQDAIRSE